MVSKLKPNPILDDKIVYSNGIKIKLKQEEYCGSTCDQFDGRCLHHSDTSYYSVTLDPSQLKSFIKPNYKHFLRDKNIEIFEELSGKSKKVIRRWAIKESDKELRKQGYG